MWTRDGDGAWVADDRAPFATTSPRARTTPGNAVGTVRVLWRTYADDHPGDHPERGPDLRSVQFSAVAPTP